jgi:hypothetical protein
VEKFDTGGEEGVSESHPSPLVVSSALLHGPNCHGGTHTIDNEALETGK